MGIKSYTDALNVRRTPQAEPIPGSSQVENSAGGYSFKVDDWVRLDRFLILGSEGGSYYASERELTRASAAGVLRCLQTDGPRAVAQIVTISHEGRAPKNDPAIFALAMALKLGDSATRKAAVQAVPKVCRIGTHIFQLAEAVKAFGGWGRLTKKAFAGWYDGLAVDSLALNLLKYQSREGWSHRDLLRKAHVKAATEVQSGLFRWAVGKMTREELEALSPVVSVFKRVEAFEDLQEAAKAADNKATRELVQQACNAIVAHGLPRECIPTELLNSPEVWEALLYGQATYDEQAPLLDTQPVPHGRGMPIHALVRNLAKMTAVGLLKPNSEAARTICERLTDVAALRKSRLHPMAVLLALKTYASGHGVKGSLSWTPVQTVLDALDGAFVGTFQNVVPTGKRHMLALDVSGSMEGSFVAGSTLSCREASAALAMVTARTEQQYMIVAFTSGQYGEQRIGSGRSMHRGYMSAISPVPFSAKSTIESACKATRNLAFGGTDCALPMLYAKAMKIPVDVFSIFTDSETWAGDIHPSQALRDYRQEMGIGAKVIINGMVGNDFTLADPNDAGMLDVVGFDAAAPVIMADFARR